MNSPLSLMNLQRTGDSLLSFYISLFPLCPFCDLLLELQHWNVWKQHQQCVFFFTSCRVTDSSDLLLFLSIENTRSSVCITSCTTCQWCWQTTIISQRQEVAAGLCCSFFHFTWTQKHDSDIREERQDVISRFHPLIRLCCLNTVWLISSCSFNPSWRGEAIKPCAVWLTHGCDSWRGR